ncbi:UPF0462 protein C4orf33 homolog isoform X1 [Petromyzon marinus]|uniref:UPF0462 protein C4orf33 homolog isoform X1 n=1 Tax=Petromyzon marinus TaxID=7757 RepID=UPI003F71EDD3
MEIQIVNTWDGEPVNHDPMVMSLRPHPEGLGLQLGVTAPFFNDPPAPHSDPGQPCHQLWDYEVVEMFFLNDQMEKYLEVELCPHGQHLVLLLDGRRKIWKDDLLLDFEVMPLEDECNGVRRWQGHALVPWRYLPPGVCKFNAYAIHGSGEARVYEAFFPVPKHKVQPGMQPDFLGFNASGPTRPKLRSRPRATRRKCCKVEARTLRPRSRAETTSSSQHDYGRGLDLRTQD